MADGLEWMLELDAKLEGALGMVRALKDADAALKQVDTGLRKTEEQTKRAGEGHKKHGRDAEHLQGVLHRLTHAGLEPFLERAKQIAEFEFIRRGVDALIEAPEKLIEKVKELGEEILKAAAAEERNEAAFKNLFGAEEAEKQLDLIDEIGDHTEFTRNSLKDMTLELAQGGFEGKGLERARAAALDIASFSANAEEGASRAVSALNRLNLSGQISSRTLMGMKIKDDTYFGILGKRLGVDAKAAKKQMDEGKVKTTDALEALNTAITQRTKKKLGGSGADMESLFSARLKHVTEIPEEIFESVKDSRGYAEISDFLGEVAKKFGANSEFGLEVKRNLKEVFDYLGDQLKNVDLDQVLKTSLEILRAMPSAVKAVTETFKDLYTIGVKPVVDGIRAVYGGAKRMLGGGGEDEKKKESTLDKVLHAPNDWLFGKLFGAGKGAGDGLAKGMDQSGQKVSDAGAGMGTAAEEGANKRLDRHSPSKVFEEIGDDVAEGFAIGVERGRMRDAMFAQWDAVAAVTSRPLGRGAGGATGGGPMIEFNVGGIHIAAGAASADIPQLVEDRLRGIVPGMLQAAIEKLAQQAGSIA